MAVGPVAASAVAERYAAPLITPTPPPAPAPEVRAAERIFERAEQAQVARLTVAERFAGPSESQATAARRLPEREKARIGEEFNGLSRFRKESTEHTLAWAAGAAVVEQFRLDEADWTGFDEQARPEPRARVAPTPPPEPAPATTPTHRPGVSAAGLTVGDTAGSIFNGFDD